MKLQCHLTVNKNGSVRVSKGKPDLSWDEVSVKINMELPDMLFKKPQLEASIIVPEDAAIPKQIDVDVQDNIINSIKEITGMEVKLIIQ